MSSKDKATGPERSAGRRARDRLLAAMPLAERRLQLAGVSTAVLEGGDGPPVVLLHGQGEFAAVWLQVVPELARSHRVVIPDLPGHGASEVTDNPLTAAAVVSWLDELINETCAAPPVLAAHLLGGAIAARYAVQHSDRLAHLVLVDTLGLGWYRPSPRFALPMMRFVAHPTARGRDRMFNRCFLDINRVAELTGEQWRWLGDYALDRARTSSVQAAMRRLIPRLGMPPIPSGDLKRIAVPTSLIHGRQDLQVRLRTAETAGSKYGWPLHVIEDCRDDPAVEQPEAFLDAMHAVLARSTKEETR